MTRPRRDHYRGPAGSPGLPVEMGNPLGLVTTAVGVAPGLVVLSTGFPSVIAPRRPVMRKASAEMGAAARATDHDLCLARMKANVSDVLEPGGDRLAVGDHIHSYSAAHRLTDLTGRGRFSPRGPAARR